VTALGTLLALAGVCGGGGGCGTSNTEVRPDGGGAGTTGGAGATGTGGNGGPCAPRTTFAEASHTVVNVSWRAGLASTAGSGQVHLWAKTVVTASGNTLTGTLQACGSVLPATTLGALAGGGMLLIEIPDAAWDAPSMPRFELEATQTGWDVGSTVTYAYAALIGFTMNDPATAPWPMDYTGITMTSDAESDGSPGLTAVPRSGAGYTLPPTSILQNARVDRIYSVLRNVASTTLTRTSCDQTSGPVTFTHFENHVIGCHVMGGSDCSPDAVEFVDDNRTIYEVAGATARTKVVAETATCADVRAALPM
jgi:hypothetical protein